MTDRLTELDEHALIQCTQQGDTEAFSPLVSKHHTCLYKHILRRVSDPETAKDLTQETWLKALRAINTFRFESTFSSWLHRIAENVCIDHFRKQKHDTEPLHAIDERNIIEIHPSPCQVLLHKELQEHLTAAIVELPPIRRHVFRLYKENLPIKAIALRLKRSEGTIKTHLRNARLQLRERLTIFFNDF